MTSSEPPHCKHVSIVPECVECTKNDPELHVEYLRIIPRVLEINNAHRKHVKFDRFTEDCFLCCGGNWNGEQ